MRGGVITAGECRPPPCYLTVHETLQYGFFSHLKYAGNTLITTAYIIGIAAALELLFAHPDINTGGVWRL